MIPWLEKLMRKSVNTIPQKQVQKQSILFIFLNYLCMGLHCCLQAFCSCGEQGLLSSCDKRTYHCGAFSCCGAQALGALASVVVVHGLSCSVACGIFLDQGSNLCPLHWQAGYYPLDHQGSPKASCFKTQKSDILKSYGLKK